MKIIRSVKKMSRMSAGWYRKGIPVGFVPTMGALHAGHMSLVSKARRENGACVVSIFVNPKQFGPEEDYLRYPRPLRIDVKKLRSSGVDVLFIPRVKDMYPDGFDTWVESPEISKYLCGAYRPGHFRGVATVVVKLFNIVRPARAYFGMKDFQQLRVIEKAVRELNLNIKVIPCAIIREEGGLAISSRNIYLTRTERDTAVKINKALRKGRDVIKSKRSAASTEVIDSIKGVLKGIPGNKIDYISVSDPKTLRPVSSIKAPVLLAIAVWVGKARLIDNLLVK